jgi:hypothetical protein
MKGNHLFSAILTKEAAMAGTKIAFIVFCTVLVAVTAVAMYRAHKGGMTLKRIVCEILGGIFSG